MRWFSILLFVQTASPAVFDFSSGTPKGRPVWVDRNLPDDLHPDSVRVKDGATVVPSKLEWRAPKARISWISTGGSSYSISYSVRSDGPAQRLAEPAMIGTGDRITFGRLGVKGKLSVGLWAHPAPVDIDADGAMDLIVSCADRPYN